METRSQIGNPAPYLSVYRPSWSWRAFALAFLALGTIFAIHIWREVRWGLAEPRPFEIAIGAVLVLVGTALVAHTFTESVRFTTDAIERATLVGVKRLPLSNIRGRREYAVSGHESGRTRYLKLEPNDDRLPTLDFSRNYDFDDAFYKWFHGLPDLDEMDKEAPKTSNFGLV